MHPHSLSAHPDVLWCCRHHSLTVQQRPKEIEEEGVLTLVPVAEFVDPPARTVHVSSACARKPS